MMDALVSLIEQKHLLELRHMERTDLDKILEKGLERQPITSGSVLNAYFKLLLARKGATAAFAELEGIRSAVPLDQYIWVGSFLSRSIGDFERQAAFLDLAEPVSQAWMMRERVRNLIFRCHFGKAASIAISLWDADNELFSGFSANALWQLGEWQTLNSRRARLEMLSTSIPFYLEYTEAASNGEHKIPIYTIFNPYTQHQLEFQKVAFSKVPTDLRPALGVVTDRLPAAVIQLVGGSSPSLGIVGATIGHLRAWEQFLDSGEHLAFVTESDSFLCSGIDYGKIRFLFKEHSIDFLLCSDRHCPVNVDTVTGGVRPFEYKGRASGFDGYCITRQCAEKALDRFSTPPYLKHIDGAVIDWLCRSEHGKVFVTQAPLFAQSIHAPFSTRAKMELDY